MNDRFADEHLFGDAATLRRTMISCDLLSRNKDGTDYRRIELPRSALSVNGEEHVRWHRSSKKVRRGFCVACGSTLFWDPLNHDWTAVAMGVFDDATGTGLSMHIFVAEKGDYYAIKS